MRLDAKFSLCENMHLFEASLSVPKGLRVLDVQKRKGKISKTQTHMQERKEKRKERREKKRRTRKKIYHIIWDSTPS